MPTLAKPYIHQAFALSADGEVVWGGVADSPIAAHRSLKNFQDFK